MKVNGVLYDVRLSEYDNQPIKNKLPEEIRGKFLTRKQWLEEGMTPKKDAIEYEMHPNSMNKKLCTYYFETDVEKLNDDIEMCANCRIRGNSRFCVVMGEHVNMEWHCSEWDGKN